MRSTAPQKIKRLSADYLIHSLSTLRYVKSLGFDPYPWQAQVLQSGRKRKLINGARQSGKSTVIASKPCHRAKFFPRSLSIIVAATEKQAAEDMEKVKDFIGHDPTYPRLVKSNEEAIETEIHSRIIIVAATERSARGYSNPDIIILDEASRIEDVVYKSGIRPMLTDNPKCELIVISTPNGRKGFFYKAYRSARWERYEIRSPWDVDREGLKLVPARAEEKFRAACAAHGIFGFYSPRHANLEEQQENLEDQGPTFYRQECCVEFVEPSDQVFSYDEIEQMFQNNVKAMDFGLVEKTKTPALEVPV